MNYIFNFSRKKFWVAINVEITISFPDLDFGNKRLLFVVQLFPLSPNQHADIISLFSYGDDLVLRHAVFLDGVVDGH